MLQTIRDGTSGWVAKFFLGAIAVVFVFWGLNFESSTATFAAKVDGEKIPVETVQRAWQQRQSQLQQMMRGELPPELVKQQQQALLDEFVRTHLLTQRANEFGYRVSDEELARQITEFPELQVDGKFSRDRYAMLLRQQGRTEPQFERELRGDLAIRQIQSGVVDSAFVAPYELERRYALEKQARELDYALIPASDFAAQISVTDAQMQAWYDAHKTDYMLPEKVDLQYVELNRASSEAAVSVTDEALKDYYEQVKERYESPERRHAQHILITATDGLDDAAAQKKAEELAAKAKAGADFAQLAKENSKDPGSAQKGGDLGWAQRGMFVGPFEDALFSMNKGEIRGPIKTQFGYHVIRLEDVEAGHLRSFDEVRPELEVEFRKDRSQTAFYDASQKLAELAFAALTELDSVAKTLNVPIKTISGFTREGGGELGAEPAVIEAVFSEDVLDRGRNSTLVTVGEDRALVLRVAKHIPAEPRPFADVRAQIESQLKTQATHDAAAKKGAEALALLQKGTDWATVASQLKLTPVGKRFVTREDTVAPAAIVRAAFEVPPSEIAATKPHYAGAATQDGNYAVFAVTDVRSGNPAAESATDRATRQRQVESQIGSGEFAAYVAESESKAKIVRNDKLFQ
ncbi:MAG TPA: SurA N-terminal domain-containing protein [Steroidobacteraceae bacterium]|jgi:peptidyl-prolyl cis-trans isomerase D